jgi:hypothetical protein
MKCEDIRKQLDDFMDGELTTALEEEVRSHLASCRSCREELTTMEDLLHQLAALPVEEEPARDLWSGVGPHLGEQERGRKPSSFYLPMLAAAAVLLLAFLIVPSLLGPGDGIPGDFDRQVPGRSTAATVAETSASLAGSLDYKDLDARFAMVRHQLLIELEEGGHQLAPETVKLIQNNLTVMEDAAEEIRNALEKDPGNTGLRKMLLASYRQQVYWLNQFREIPEIL